MKQPLISSALCLSFSIILISVLTHYNGRRTLPKLPPDATLVLSEDFNDPKALSAFQLGEPDLGYTSGKEGQAAWRIEDGKLNAEQAHNAALWLKSPLPSGDLRVSFKVTALSEQGDVKCEIFGDGQRHQSGYIIINGGWKNSVRAIARQDEHGEDRHNDHRCSSTPSRHCVPPQTEQTWVIERHGDRIDWYIDGVFTLSYRDRHPVRGQHFAFNNWSAPAAFDELRIYQLDSH